MPLPRHTLPTALLILSQVPAATATALQLETVEVVGQRVQDDLQRQLALTPGGVSLIDGESLYQRNVANLSEMLRFSPGIWSDSSSGGSAVFLSSRGSNLDATNYDMNGIKLLQDGLPVTTADGNNHNRLIDPLSSRYATVARGANAMAYGASTLGGAINFVSPTAHNSSRLEAYLNGGSDGLVNARTSMGGVAGELDGLLTLDYREYDGYREHSAEQRRGAYANAGWQFAQHAETRLYFTYLNEDRELPGSLSAQQLAADPEQATSAARSGDLAVDVDTWRVANITRWAIGEDSELSFGLSWEEQALFHPIVDVRVDFDGPGPQLPTQVFSLLIDSQQRNLGSMLRYNTRRGAHDLLLGLNYGESEVDGGYYSHTGAVKTRLDNRIDNAARSVEAFALDRWQFADAWTLVYGLQAVWAERETRNERLASGTVINPRGEYDSVNPRLGLIFRLDDNVDLFASLSRTYEAPTNYELEDDISAGQDTLDAMHGSVFEVGSRGQQDLGERSSWRWDVALYYGLIEDEILSRDDPAAPGTSLTTNVDDTVHAGLEALVTAHLALDTLGTHSLAPTLSLTVNEFDFDGDTTYGDNQLPAAPGYALRGELLYRHASGFYAGPTFDLIDARYADFSNSFRVDGYQLLGLRAGYEQDNWQLFVECRNLLDEDYVSTFSVRDRAAADAPILNPGAGRAVFAGIRFSL